MANYRINTSDELYHHGVLGMKWGVRRYQNYNGSYTQAGLKRYEKSASTYEDLKAKKKQYGSRTMMDSRTTYGRATKLAKQRMKKDYKHLKQDKLADQGKNLYANGYRITDNVGTKMAKQIDYFYKNDESVKKGRELVKKYDMTSWDDLAAKNENRMKHLNETMTKLS